MSLRNPYNVSRPGTLFTGHVALRRRILDGVVNGASFAITGGRRCGKTSLLLRLRDDLATYPGSMRLLPRFLDMQGEIPHTKAEFFGMVAKALAQEMTLPAWTASGGQQPYQEFLVWAQDAVPKLTEKHGPDWLCVLLIDELEVAAHYLQDEECFHNLRNLLMNSSISDRVRVVASGVSGLAQLTTRGSPLNNLEGEPLSFLSGSEAIALIKEGYASTLSDRVQERLLDLSGGHPWILQGLLGYLWEERESVDVNAVEAAAGRFVRNRDDVFVSWMKSFGEAGKTAFGRIARAADDCIAIREVRAAIPGDVTVDSVLRVLCYHGVVRETSGGHVRFNGLIFRDWFNQNVALLAEDIASEPLGTVETSIAHRSLAKNKRVFVVFGRDRKLYSAVIRFLRTLRLEPVEWTHALDETKNGSASIKEILDQAFTMAQAVVVLLTPDDEARLRPVFHGPQEPSHEREFTPQPRPNVLFEAGFAMARFPRATILVRFDRTTRLFSDIGGVYLLDLSNDFDDRQRFVQRLRTCGMDVDDSGTEWHTSAQGGDFTPAI